MTAKKHDVALKFRSFYWDAAFPVAEAKGFYDKGLQYVVTWEPWDPSKGISQPQFSNTAITTNQSFTSSTGSSVKFDDYIGSWATSIKNYKKPVYVRFAHEMNGNWYPWGNGNSNTSASYVAMWKHVHDIFEQKGVKNVRWIWCVNNDPSNTVASYYPGNSYVDVSAIDGYNWGNTRTWSSWTDFRYVISNAYNAVTSVSNKPVWVAETASAESGGAKSTWITNAFASKTLFPKLNTIIWFNTNKETDWRVNSSTGALNSYKAAVPTF
jgi:beta-mannanase